MAIELWIYRDPETKECSVDKFMEGNAYSYRDRYPDRWSYVCTIKDAKFFDRNEKTEWIQWVLNDFMGETRYKHNRPWETGAGLD